MLCEGPEWAKESFTLSLRERQAFTGVCTQYVTWVSMECPSTCGARRHCTSGCALFFFFLSFFKFFGNICASERFSDDDPRDWLVVLYEHFCLFFFSSNFLYQLAKCNRPLYNGWKGEANTARTCLSRIISLCLLYRRATNGIFGANPFCACLISCSDVLGLKNTHTERHAHILTMILNLLGFFSLEYCENVFFVWVLRICLFIYSFRFTWMWRRCMVKDFAVN